VTVTFAKNGKVTVTGHALWLPDESIFGVFYIKPKGYHKLW